MVSAADIGEYIHAYKEGQEIPPLIRKVFEAVHDFNGDNASLRSIQRDLHSEGIHLSRKQIKAILDLDKAPS